MSETGANLLKAVCCGADLRGADFRGSNGKPAIACGANETCRGGGCIYTSTAPRTAAAARSVIHSAPIALPCNACLCGEDVECPPFETCFEFECLRQVGGHLELARAGGEPWRLLRWNDSRNPCPPTSE